MTPKENDGDEESKIDSNVFTYFYPEQLRVLEFSFVCDVYIIMLINENEKLPALLALIDNKYASSLPTYT